MYISYNLESTTRQRLKAHTFIIKNDDMKTIGIDVSKKSLSVAAVISIDQFNDKVLGTKKFTNDENGIKQLIDWAKKKAPENDTRYVMEATGTYYELAADELYQAGLNVVVELPNKIKNYSKSLNIKTKTDEVDAKVIAMYALHNKTREWKPMSKYMSEMRAYSRQILAMKDDLTRYKNQLHAMNHSAHTPEVLKEDLAKRIEQVEKDIETYQHDLLNLAAKDDTFMKKVRKITTMKGVRELTVISVLCETNGFSVCSNMRQAVSYAGLDVSVYQSGTICSKGRISKKGNARIRKILYLPALSASFKGNESFKNLYARLVERNPNRKKVPIIAVERKLYTMIYTLWRKDEPYTEGALEKGSQATDSDKAQTECKITK